MIEFFKKLSTYLNVSPCLLCLSSHPTPYALCEDCIAALPWIENACIGCGLPLIETRIQKCGPCELMALPYDGVKCLFEYKWPCDHFIAQIKFKKKLALVNLLGHLMAEQFGKNIDTRPTCLIPVPLHLERLKERGFNQAYLLAKVIGQKLNIPVLWNEVKKIKHTRAQASLSIEERMINLKAIFEVNPHFPQQYKSKVAIIDDVMTTGQTVSSLTMALKAIGIQQVEIWCCCRTLKPKMARRSPLLRPIL